MALFCAAIRRESVSLLGFPFLSHVQVFLYEISSVCRLKYPYSCFSSNFFPSFFLTNFPHQRQRHSLEFERQQIFSRLLDSPQYSNRSQQSCSLDGPYSSSDFQLFQYPFQTFGDWSKHANLQLVSLSRTCCTASLILWHSLITYNQYCYYNHLLL